MSSAVGRAWTSSEKRWKEWTATTAWLLPLRRQHAVPDQRLEQRDVPAGPVLDRHQQDARQALLARLGGQFLDVVGLRFAPEPGHLHGARDEDLGPVAGQGLGRQLQVELDVDRAGDPENAADLAV